MMALLLPSLNYDEKDPKFQLLGKIFNFMNKKKNSKLFEPCRY